MTEHDSKELGAGYVFLEQNALTRNRVGKAKAGETAELAVAWASKRIKEAAVWRAMALLVARPFLAGD